MEGGKRSGPTARLAGKVSYTCDGVCVGGGGGKGGLEKGSSGVKATSTEMSLTDLLI